MTSESELRCLNFNCFSSSLPKIVSKPFLLFKKVDLISLVIVVLGQCFGVVALG